LLERVLEKSQISNLAKILPVGAELLQADRQTHMTKLIVPFCNFGNAPNKIIAHLAYIPKDQNPNASPETGYNDGHLYSSASVLPGKYCRSSWT